jgi:hypothetical protein
MDRKRIIGIILSVVGGIGSVIFGQHAVTVRDGFFMTEADMNAAAMKAYILVAVAIVVFIVGIVLVITKATKA